MKIGFDAKWFYEGPPSGKVVIRNLIEHIIKENKEDELIIFLDNKFKNNKFPFKGANIHLEYIWAGNNLISNLFVLPFRAKRLGVEVVLYQNFADFFPFYKKVSYIHDVLFLTHPQFYTWKERLYFAPLKFLTHCSDLVVTVSESEKKRLIATNYASSEKIHVVYHGVNPIFKPLEEQKSETINKIIRKYRLPEKFILFVGRLNVRKNVAKLIHAFKLTNADIPLVIVGKTDWKTQDYKLLAKNLGLQEKVFFLDSIYGEELAILYSLAQIFCFPSYAESFGLPVLEAMASGTPVITSYLTALPEVCGNVALFIKPNSPEDIAEKIDFLIENHTLQAKLKMEGIKRAKQFNWSNSSKYLIDSIHNVFP